jgi:hypothetical protein
MTDLISFVRARLDEREALYRKFVQPPADPPGVYRVGYRR